MPTPLPEATIVDLPIKLKSERRLERKFRSIFKEMADLNQAEMSTFRSIPDFSIFTDELEGIVRTDSSTTSRSFRKNLRKKLKLGNVEAARINQEIENYIAESSRRQAEFIISTTNRRVEDAVITTLAESAEQLVELSDEELAKEVTSKFRKGNRNRAKGIALTEVQRVSEKTKFIEADILQRSGTTASTEKRWDAILDQKVRHPHAIADGQIVPLNEPFIVNGELLMQPGDTSLGASVKNVVNCRCSVQYITNVA